MQSGKLCRSIYLVVFPPELEFKVSTGEGLFHVYPICGICGDAFQDTHSPLLASLSANSSTRLPFGLRLPCPDRHPYCVGCLSQYIVSKLDPDGIGGAPAEQIISPIRCPECPLGQWGDGVQDDVAERVLTRDSIVLWVGNRYMSTCFVLKHEQHHRKLLDSLPRYYCPNKQCSALVQLHEETSEPRGICPSCRTTICIPCRTQWHDSKLQTVCFILHSWWVLRADLTCEEYQARSKSFFLITSSS